MLVSRLCIIGVGLIGGSLALALKRAGAVGHVVGCGRGTRNLQRAAELGVIDEYTTNPAEAAAGADVVLLAVPLGANESVMTQLRPALGKTAILTDVGSAKRCVIEAARQVFGAVPSNFVAGHPIAGNEQSGAEAAFDSLYQDHRVILTPTEETDADALARVRSMWQVAGAEVLTLDADHHDQVLAATSHLPHMLAYALVDTLGRLDEQTEIFRYAAGGFRDFTRIASSDPTMWHDICIANRDALLVALRRFQADLQDMTDAIERADSEVIREVFTRAKLTRDAHVGSIKLDVDG